MCIAWFKALKGFLTLIGRTPRALTCSDQSLARSSHSLGRKLHGVVKRERMKY